MPTKVKGKTYYLISEVSRMSGVSKRTIYRWIHNGIISGGQWRDRKGWRLFAEEDITELISKAEKVQLAVPVSGLQVTPNINESILKDTTQCRYEFACLKMEEYPLCQVTGQTILGSGIYVNAPTGNSCFYKVNWESNYICLCPTRSELWQQYKK
ncbi:MerR family transcriptional regulator [Chloroflexota bacterium]